MSTQVIIAIAIVMGASIIIGIIGMIWSKTGAKKKILNVEKWINNSINEGKSVINYSGRKNVFRIDGNLPDPKDTHQLMGTLLIKIDEGKHTLTYQFDTTNILGSNFKTKKETLEVDIKPKRQYIFTLGEDGQYYQDYDVVIPLSAFGKTAALLFGEDTILDSYKRDFNIR